MVIEKLLSLSLFFSIISPGCTRIPAVSYEPSGIDSSVPKYQDDIAIPTGKEATLDVQIVGKKKALITVHNDSDSAVFVPYFPGGKNKFALYAIWEIEKVNPETHGFEPWGEGHLGTGLKALSGHDLYKDTLVVPEHGRYRISVTYLIDSDLVERINSLARLDEGRRATEEAYINRVSENASVTLTSDSFDL